MICPRCNKEIHDQETECIRCGYKVEYKVPRENLPVLPIIVDDNKIKCPTCGRILPSTSRACFICKTKFKNINAESTSYTMSTNTLTDKDNYFILYKVWWETYVDNLQEFGWSMEEVYLFNDFSRALSESNEPVFIPSKPISATTAAAIGTSLGGTAVGVAAAMDAMNKEEKYKRDKADYYQRLENRGRATNNVRELYGKMMYKIRRNPKAYEAYKEREKKYIEEKEMKQLNVKNNSSNGCYVATCVYGSYDCPEVWTLRRYRDYCLAKTWYGKMFIHMYYAISPVFVKCFGHTDWFKKIFRGTLDQMVKNLQEKGYESTPYKDCKWE